MNTILKRGVDPMEYASKFENSLISRALSALGTYITCFWKPADQNDFQHGLLSQWRGYAADGGFALQFSRTKLKAEIAKVQKEAGLSYDLQDVFYETENPLRDEVLKYSETFVRGFSAHLDELAKPIDFNRLQMRNPLAGLENGPLEALLIYLVHTKNSHFREERECRLSLTQGTQGYSSEFVEAPVLYFDRGGMPVPYTQTSSTFFNLLACIEEIVIGRP